MGMSTTLKSSFCGASLKQTALNKPASTQVAFAVRAAGYDDELVKTAVRAISVPSFMRFLCDLVRGGFADRPISVLSECIDLAENDRLTGARNLGD